MVLEGWAKTELSAHCCFHHHRAEAVLFFSIRFPLFVCVCQLEIHWYTLRCARFYKSLIHVCVCVGREMSAERWTASGTPCRRRLRSWSGWPRCSSPENSWGRSVRQLTPRPPPTHARTRTRVSKCRSHSWRSCVHFTQGRLQTDHQLND